jgi:hypothetical protein
MCVCSSPDFNLSPKEIDMKKASMHKHFQPANRDVSSLFTIVCLLLYFVGAAVGQSTTKLGQSTQQPPMPPTASTTHGTQITFTPCSKNSAQYPCDNGITVGQTKIFDERELRSMMAEAESSLEKISAINGAQLQQATGTLQGARESDSSFSLTATTLPGVEVGHHNRPAENPTPAPSVPTAPTQLNQSATMPTFGIGSQDLLAEQMSLQYEIINLRLLLNRSLTDRVYIENLPADPNNPNGRGAFIPSPRAQTVAGFRISVVPSPKYENAVAEVEVVIGSNNGKRPSLVTLLPRDKTYNVASVTKDAKAFGLGAVVEILNVGANIGRSNETQYLVKDTDTVALEELAPHAVDKAIDPSQATTFGWQFRPVLGRKAVDSGTRDVFAMLALPMGDRFADPYTGTVDVYTHWRRYNSKTHTVGEIIPGSENHQSLDALDFRAGNFYDTVLAPTIESVKWENIGDGQVLVQVKGANYLSGTSVMSGSTVINSPDKGLFLQGENVLIFRMDGTQLASYGAPLMVGRYGPPVRIENASSLFVPPRVLDPSLKDKHYGLRLTRPPNIYPIDADNTKVELEVEEIRYAEGENYNTDIRRFNYRPVMIIGSKTYGLVDPGMEVSNPAIKKYPNDNSSQQVEIADYHLAVTVSNDTLRSARLLTVKEPFYGDEFATTYHIGLGENDFTATDIQPLVLNGKATQYIIKGTRFQNTIHVNVGGKEFCESGCDGKLTVINQNLIRLEAVPEDFKGVKSLMVYEGSNHAAVAVALQLPKPPSVPTPVVEKADDVTEGDVKTFTIKGTDFGSIEDLKFEGKSLDVDIAPDGTSMNVTLTSAVTAKAGDKELQLHLKNGAITSYILKVQKK